MTTYTTTRPIMTNAELATHKAAEYGRDYRESDDGYSDMEAEEKRGWSAIPGWGRDGWDLGNWPYVVIYKRETLPGGDAELIRRNRVSDQQDALPGVTVLAPEDKPRFELMQICEGDRTVYRFDSIEDRNAAVDYLFLWYSADESWSPVTWQNRAELDDGELKVDDRLRGPYRSE